MRQLIFKTEFLDQIRSRTKVQTIRSWKKDRVKAGEIVAATNYKQRFLIKIDLVKKKPFSEVTQEEALLDGFPSLEALRHKVLEIYGSIEFEATIIRFSLVEDLCSK